MTKKSIILLLIFLSSKILFAQKKTVLFHGSLTPGLTQLSPLIAGTKHPAPLVFATQEVAVALGFALSRFLFQHHCEYAFRCVSHSNEQSPVFFAIACDEETIKRADPGGSVYLLPSYPFTQANFGARYSELISKTPVNPLAEIRFHSLFQGLQSIGGRIIFVSPKELGYLIQNGEDHDDVVDSMINILNKI